MTSNSPCLAPELVAEAEQLAEALRSKHLSVVTAESCTAGLLAAVIAQTVGASTFLHGGFVTYTKDQKTIATGVPAELLKQTGSVTRSVALGLAEGALERSKADIAIGITGVLGPEPDEDSNPVGLVYIAVAKRSAPSRCVRKEYGGQHHEWIRRQVVRDACLLALDAIADR